MVYPLTVSESKKGYLPWVAFSHKVAQVGFVSSVLFGSILIGLNVFVTRKVVGTYKHLMNIFTSLGIIFATMEVILYPNIHSYNAGFFYFSVETPFGLSQKAVTVFLVVYKCFYCATTALISVQFIYRYWAVFNNELFEHYIIFIDETSALAYVAYDPETFKVRWFNLMFTICITCVMSAQYIIMIYCGWSMHLEMEARIENFSCALKRLHKQFFKTLILQITAPTLFLFIPIGFLIYLPLLDLDLNIPTGTIICAFSLYPALDALIVLSVVSEYRISAKRVFRKWLRQLLEWMSSSDTETTTSATRPTNQIQLQKIF